LLDGGAPFYGTYACADGQFVAVGPLEPQFFAELVEKLGFDSSALGDRWRPQFWPAWREALAAAFAKKTRDEWAEIFADSDACVAPVLSLEEAPTHPHNVARETFAAGRGGQEPQPAPRFSRTPGAIAGAPPSVGADTFAILREQGFSDARIAELKSAGVI
jgi:alpha-methylacyl-CoA racemase